MELGNKLRIELFDAFELTPDRVGFVPTNNNYQEKTLSLMIG